MILVALLRRRKQDLTGTQKSLNMIKKPEAALTVKQQGYYNYLHGIIYSQTNLTTAEKYFKKALKFGLTMDYDIAMAKLSLAGIAMQKRRKREATMLLNEAKKLDKNDMLKDQIKMMQQQMKKI
jgi:tetratricopeptide (TPR) repeat protein